MIRTPFTTSRLPADFQKSGVESASLPAAPNVPNLKFEREDWSLFRTIEGLQQRAGVPKDDLALLILKELADNGLDTNTAVDIGRLPNGRGWFVEDAGSGIGGTPAEIAALFSIARPMVSTKLLRLPQRGALGNGLRVVAGSVIASGKGSFLTVITRNRRIELRPERDGTTTVVSTKAVKHPVGTRVEIGFGPALPCDGEDLHWALQAEQLGTGHALMQAMPQVADDELVLVLYGDVPLIAPGPFLGFAVLLRAAREL